MNFVKSLIKRSKISGKQVPPPPTPFMLYLEVTCPGAVNDGGLVLGVLVLDPSLLRYQGPQLQILLFIIYRN